MRCEFFRSYRERIYFLHGVRDEILSSRKNFPDRTHLCRYMFDTVNDLTLIVTENNIAVFSHDLDDQIFPAEVTKFIEMFNCKMNNTLKSRLPDINNAAAADMFTKKHTEVWSSHRTWLILRGQIDQRKRSIRRNRETILTFR